MYLKGKVLKLLTRILIFSVMNAYAESFCFHSDYADDRIKCLKSSLGSDAPVNFLNKGDKAVDKNDTSCSVKNIFESLKVIDDLEDVESLKVITVRDQKIYSLFTPHLLPPIIQSVLDTSLLLFGNSEQKEEGYKKLKNILNSRSDIVKSEKDDVLTMVELLRSDSADLKWIGIETSEDALKEHSIPERVDDDAFYRNTLKRVLTSKDVDDILYLISDAHIIAVAKHLELFEGIEFVPLGDNVYDRRSDAIYNEVSRILTDLYFIASSTENLFVEDIREVTTIMARAMRSTNKIPQQLISDELNKWKDEESRSLVAELFSNTNQFVGYIIKRDQAIASTVLRQSGNGLILLGSAHSEGVTQRLLSACRDLQ